MRRPFCAEIQRAVADYYGLTLDELRGDCRQRRYAWPRQIAMMVSQRVWHREWSHLGHIFQRNRTTVRFGVQAMERRLSRAPQLRADVRTIERRLGLRACYQKEARRHGSDYWRAPLQPVMGGMP